MPVEDAGSPSSSGNSNNASDGGAFLVDAAKSSDKDS
jgi:hypothetical protein